MLRIRGSIIIVVVLLLVSGVCKAQFLDNFDKKELEGWFFFTGDGFATMNFVPQEEGFATIYIDATKDPIELLTEEQYRELQKMGDFDVKTSSWVETPPDIREAGGALFCDFRYGHVFVYHNGAQSYYAARGFRGS